MNKRMKAGSWANLRAFSVNLRDKVDKVDLKDSFVDDKSNSFGSADCTDAEPVWHEELGNQKSFSFSTIALQRARSTTNSNSENNSGNRTPLSKRRSSVKRIFGRKSTGSAAPIPPAWNAEKIDVQKKKDKTVIKRDSLYFNLYSDALEKGLFSNEELEIWNIQGQFPNDDLRLYEGLFTIEDKDETLSPVAGNHLTSLPMTQTEASFKSKVSFQEKQDLCDGFDIPCSPAIPRKMVTAKAVIHPITHFRHSHNHHRPPQVPTISSQFPAFQRLSAGLQAKFKKMAQRRQSAPSIVIRGVLGRPAKPQSAFQGRDDNAVPYSPNVNSQRLSLKFGSHGATLNLSKRKYVMEGKVQLTAGMQTQDRYMFLFTDLLLIAKAKSGSNFKLKYRIRVCELWTASCLDEVCELGLQKVKDTSFVIGWPTTNFVATFSTPESKELWLSALLKKIHEEKEKETPKVVTLKIINRDSSNINHIKMLKVPHNDTAKDVVRNAVKEFGFEENGDQYQLWVTSKKEGTAYPLIGHENPHAIHVNHVRDFISANGILPETEITSVSKYENMIEPEIRDRCQFILKNCRQAPKYGIDLARRKPSRIKAATPSKSFFHWNRKRSGQRNESSDSGHVSGNSVGSEGTTFFPSSPPSTSPPATPKLFSLPLGQVCDNAELPSPIATMFDILFRKAPYTSGIFRKSASAKLCRQLRNKLNEELDIDLEKEPIHVVAALLKEFLRQIPDSVLDCAMYDKWTRAIRNSSEEEKLKSVRRLLMSLDACNRVLVRRLSIVLNRVASRSDRNQMTAHNSALCISPSLLWPLGPASQIDSPMKVTEVTELLQYFIEHCDEIFEGIVPTDVDWPSKIESKSDNEEEYEGDEKQHADECVSPISDDVTNGSDFCEVAGRRERHDDDDDSNLSQFNRSLVTRRQFPRRKTGTRIDATTRLMSLSQDSLDKVLMDVNRNPSQQTLDDIVLNESEMSSTHYINKRGKGYVSNDSGFTTLSGEEEENTLNRSTAKEIAEFHMSCSEGSNFNELDESTGEQLEISFSGLRTLWAPNLLNIENGQILDDVELHGIQEEQNTERHYSPFSRRRSQPVLQGHNESKNTVGNTVVFELTSQSRPIHAATLPVIEFDESDDDMTSFVAKSPTYVRLNDLPPHDRSDIDIHDDSQSKDYVNELRRTSQSEATESVEKADLSSRTKKLYTSGANVTVNDVRLPETTCYRPVTLSIRGLGQTSHNGIVIRPESDNLSNVTTTNDKPFYIGDEESLDSISDTPDRLSSSQEDVFNEWNNQGVSSDRSRGRSKTDGEIYSDNSVPSPVTRKCNSTTSRSEVEIDVTFVQGDDVSDPRERSFSIQKLTENLQQIPDLKQRTCHVKSVIKEPDTSFNRKRTSVRESRKAASSQSNTHVHVSKATFQTQIHDHHDQNSENQGGEVEEAPPSSTNSFSPVNSSSQKSDAEMTRPCTDRKSFDRGVRSRRGCGRRRISANTTQDAGASPFSQSLPTTGWRNLKSKSSTCDQSVQDATLTPQNSNPIPSPVTSNTNHAQITEKTISSGDTATKSSASRSSTRRSHRRNHEKMTVNSEQSMNSTYDNSTSATSHKEGGLEKIRVRRKLGVAIPPTKIATKSAPSPTTVSNQQHRTERKSDKDGHVGLAIRTSSPNAAVRSDGEKQSITVQVSAPANYHSIRSEQVPHTISHQPVSDNLLFTLSESFAFGNRKSPRSIVHDPSCRENSVFSTSVNVESQTASREIQHTVTPERRTRHYSVDRYVETSSKPKINVHVTSLSVRRHVETNKATTIKHLEPPKAPKIIPRDKNANDLLPFIGIIQSEESYV